MGSATTETEALTRLPARELAARIARGEVSAAEVVEAHIARIEQVNPALNAVVVQRYDAARAEARAADERRARGEPLGPLHGVPVTIKESLDVAGMPATFGITTRVATSATADDRYVARLREAGAIILGKTNVAQLLFYNESDNPVYGRTSNPWNVGRTPGGSSGGEGAIIAADGSPLGLGTDIAGSLRHPATFCGIVSLKPTAGRTPDAGRYSLPVGQRAIVSQVGPLARTVDDAALALEVINGGRNPDVEPAQPLGDPTTVDLSTLRVAYYSDDGTFTVSPAVRRAVVEAAGMLAGRGAQVLEWQPPDVPVALDVAYGIFSADGGRGMRRALRGSKVDPRIGTLLRLAGVSRQASRALSRLLRLMGDRHTARAVATFGYRDTLHYWRLVEAQLDYQERFLHALDTDEGGPFDVIVCPAWPLPAIPHGASATLLSAGAYALLYNVLGYPTGVVPVTRVQPGEESQRRRSPDRMERAARKAEQGSAGLPVGVQVVARPWREHVALAAMRAIEEAARQRDDFPLAPSPC